MCFRKQRDGPGKRADCPYTQTWFYFNIKYAQK